MIQIEWAAGYGERVRIVCTEGECCVDEWMTVPLAVVHLAGHVQDEGNRGVAGRMFGSGTA